MLHGLEHFCIGVASNHMINPIAATVREANVDGIGAAEEVVQIAHYLLVGAAQKEANQIGFTRF